MKSLNILLSVPEVGRFLTRHQKLTLNLIKRFDYKSINIISILIMPVNND